MEFLIWHYTQGFDLYLKRWLFYLRWIFRYFSLTLLLKTLFSPWKRLVEEDTSPGFNLSRYFETLTFNAMSRAIGAIVRIILFFSGLVFLFFSFFAGAFGVIFWVILPILGLPSYLRFKKQPKQFMQTLFYKIKKGLKNPLEIIFNSNPGKFFLDHTTITYEELLKNSKLDNKFFDNYQADSFSELILKLVKKKTWTQEFLQKHTLSK